MPQLPKKLEKKIFYILAGIMLIAMPLLSLKSGISGDEETFHYPHGKNVYNYYKTFGKDTTCLHYEKSALHMYGPVFDVITVATIHVFNAEDEYQVRHILNSIAGWGAIISAALIAVMLGGWRAGIITLLFMFFSPRFLGHSFNNPKDIPFAAAYIFTIYGIIRFLKYYPENIIKHAWPIALGIGLTIGVRVGGILLAIYFLFFTGVFYLVNTTVKEWLKKDNLIKLSRLMLIAIAISIAGYIIGVILWPYAHKAPLAKTIEAMKYMEKYATSLRQVFEGVFIWSDNVPNRYLPKYILMTIPEYIILGFIGFLLISKNWVKKDLAWYFILVFISFFPVIYIILKGSNVYGGWRHVMFIYPSLVILASLGFNNLLQLYNYRWYKTAIYTIMVVLLALPARHIIASHPHEYIYYNTVTGGAKKAYGKYEMDYFYHSLRAGSDWLIENKINKITPPEGREIIVATNFSTNTKYYFRHLKDKVKVRYIRYYERGNSDWDYAILANSYINPKQLRRNIWPPKNTIKTFDIDGKAICAVLERKDRNDLMGYQLLSTKRPAEAIPFFKEAIKNDKNYEQQYLYLSKAYLDIGDYNNAIQAASTCLKLFPNYDKALNYMGLAYINLRDYENAFKVFNRNMKANPKNVFAFYYTGFIYAQTNDYNTAIKYLDKAIKVNGRYKPSYLLLARIYEIQGRSKEAQHILNFVKKLPD